MTEILKSSLQRPLTWIDLGSIATATLVFGSKKTLRYFPNVSKQGAYLCGGVMMISSFLYNTFRFDSTRFPTQTKIEKGLLFVAASTLTLGLSRTLTLRASLSLSVISSIFMTVLSSRLKNSYSQYKYYQEHPKEWSELPEQERTQLFREFYTQDFPPIYVEATFDYDLRPYDYDDLKEISKAPHHCSRAKLSWILFLNRLTLSSDFFTYCVENNLPLCQFYFNDEDLPREESLTQLFRKAPIYYYYLRKSQPPRVYYELLQNSYEYPERSHPPQESPTEKTLAGDLTPASVDAMPSHLFIIWLEALSKICYLNDPLYEHVSREAKFTFLRRASKMQLENNFTQLVSEEIYQSPLEASSLEKYSREDLVWYIQNYLRYSNFKGLTVGNLSLFYKAHSLGIPFPPLDASQLTVRDLDPSSLQQYKALMVAYPLSSYTSTESVERQELPEQIPSLEDLARRETPQSIRSMTPVEVTCWHRALEEYHTSVAPETLEIFIERFMECEHWWFNPETSSFYISKIDLSRFSEITAEEVEALSDSQAQWYKEFFYLTHTIQPKEVASELQENDLRMLQIYAKLGYFLKVLRIDEERARGLSPGARQALQVRLSKINGYFKPPPFVFTASMLYEMSSDLTQKLYFLSSKLSPAETVILFNQFPHHLFSLSEVYVSWLLDQGKDSIPHVIQGLKENIYWYGNFLRLSSELQEGLRKAFGDEAPLLPYPLTAEFIAEAKGDERLQERMIQQYQNLATCTWLNEDFGYASLEKADQQWIDQLLAEFSIENPSSRS